MARKTTKPEPIVTSTICSVCGLDWDGHPEGATKDDCIRLLMAELKREKARLTPRPTIVYPYQPFVTTPAPGKEQPNKWTFTPRPLETKTGVLAARY